MGNDIITASKCGTTPVALNAKVNSFVERKKLGLSFDKCSRIHVGPKAKSYICHNVKVHEEDINNAEKEKYLGDYVTKQANLNETLISRKTRAFATLVEIKALLNEIPLGNKKVEFGLALRKAWLINSILYNNEVWGSYSEKYIKELEVIDHIILCAILDA